jgi:hypothetical protein
MKLKLVLLFACAWVMLALTGCAQAPVKMSHSDMQALKTVPKIIAIHNGPIGPALSTAGGVIASSFTFGLASGQTGAEIMDQYGISDPIVTVKNQFLSGVMQQAQFHNLYVQKQIVPFDQRDVEDLQKRFKTGYYLQFIPGQWAVIYYVSDWSHYQMYYGAAARLIHLDDGKILWSDTCSAPRDEKEKAPTMDELKANNGEMLKQWTNQSANECAAQLVKKFLAQS